MLKRNISDGGSCNFDGDNFQLAYDFLQRNDLAGLQLGRHEISERVYALVQEYETKKVENVKWEAHNRYTDIQYVAVGHERVLISRRDALKESVPYNESKDIIFFSDSNETTDEISLGAGDLVIIGPDEAHKPGCIVETSGFVRKIVVKVPYSMQGENSKMGKE